MTTRDKSENSNYWCTLYASENCNVEGNYWLHEMNKKVPLQCVFYKMYDQPNTVCHGGCAIITTTMTTTKALKRG